jgi:hypothetical protein
MAAITAKLGELCQESLLKIEGGYKEMKEHLSVTPKNESELFKLRTDVHENEMRVARIKLEVDEVAGYIKLAELFFRMPAQEVY